MPVRSIPGDLPLPGAEILGGGGPLTAPLRAGRALARRYWLDLAVAFVVAYFAYHAVHGERGFLSWIDRTREVEVARHELTRLRQERETLAERVGRLRPGQADADAVEEELRRLGYVRPDEVILLPQAPAAR